MELDRYDQAILQALQKDGRISNQDLADRIGLSPSPCLRRLRALEDAGIVTGYRALLNAKALGYSFVDVDLIICKEAGKPLQEILDNEGLDFFLHLEGKIGAELDYDKTVIATGGSMVLSENAMENLRKNGKVVFIDVDLDEIKRRVTNIKTRGIAFGKGETLDDVYRVRYPLYKKYADITVSMELSSIETTVDAIVEKLKLEKQN